MEFLNMIILIVVLTAITSGIIFSGFIIALMLTPCLTEEDRTREEFFDSISKPDLDKMVKEIARIEKLNYGEAAGRMYDLVVEGRSIKEIYNSLTKGGFQ